MKNFSTIAWPPTLSLKKNCFCGGQEAELPFDSLKNELMTVPVLALQDFTKPFIIRTNASYAVIRAVYVQDSRSIAFYNHAFYELIVPKRSAYDIEFYTLIVPVQK